MWLLNWNTIMSDPIINLMLICGIGMCLLGVGLNTFLATIPSTKKYIFILQLTGILILAFGAYFKGGSHTEANWQLKVLQEQQRIIELERKTVEINNELTKKISEKSKIIYQKGDTIYRYIDREVTKDKEIIKFIEQCPLPATIIELHNAAATNTPIMEVAP